MLNKLLNLLFKDEQKVFSPSTARAAQNVLAGRTFVTSALYNKKNVKTSKICKNNIKKCISAKILRI